MFSVAPRSFSFIFYFLLFYCAKGYIQLSEKKFNLQSFFAFCFLLFISGILNLISPSDGKTNNMFSAIAEKNRKIVDLTPIEMDIPFHVNLTHLTVHGLDKIKANVTLSHTGKLTCVAAAANFANEELDYPEESYNRFFFQSNVSRVQSFKINTTFGEPQRLFCKAVSLIPNVKVETYFKSSPFYLRYSGWGITLSRHIVRNTTIEIHSNVEMSETPEKVVDKQVRVECTISKQTSNNLRSSDSSIQVKNEGTLPLYVTFPNVVYVYPTDVVCSVWLFDPVTKKWNPYGHSQNAITIPGFTFSDALWGNIYVK